LTSIAAAGWVKRPYPARKAKKRKRNNEKAARILQRGRSHAGQEPDPSTGAVMNADLCDVDIRAGKPGKA